MANMVRRGLMNTLNSIYKCLTKNNRPEFMAVLAIIFVVVVGMIGSIRVINTLPSFTSENVVIEPEPLQETEIFVSDGGNASSSWGSVGVSSIGISTVADDSTATYSGESISSIGMGQSQSQGITNVTYPDSTSYIDSHNSISQYDLGLICRLNDVHSRWIVRITHRYTDEFGKPRYDVLFGMKDKAGDHIINGVEHVDIDYCIED